MANGTCLMALRGLLPAELVTALETECRANRVIDHKPTVTAQNAEVAPGLGPVPYAIGTVLGARYTQPVTDRLYRVMKIDSGFCDCPSFHVHWTKSGDASELGNKVRWVLEYTVFNGTERELALVTPAEAIIDGTYDDDSTDGSRLACRTIDVPAEGLIPNYYVGLRLRVDPANTTLVSAPVLLTMDMVYHLMVE